MKPLPLSPCLLVALSLLTLPAAATEPFFFLQFSDPQFGMMSNNKDFAQETVNFEFAIATANRLKPAFVVITGDLVNKAGDPAQIAEFLRIAKQLDPAIKLYNAAGNHDVGNTPTPATLAAYVEKFGPDHYVFTHGDFTGIVLNSSLISDAKSAKELYEQQDEWLKSELAKARQGAQRGGAAHIVIFQHHPYFLAKADEKDQYFNILLERRTPHLALFHEFGVKYIFTGHLHQPTEARDGPIDMIVTGSTGKALGKAKSGFRIAAVRDSGIEHRWYELSEVPNKIDLMTWPDKEMLKQEPAKK